MTMPLEGYKVIELGTEVSVPACCKMLSDYGAEVIKIETLQGDNWRTGGLSLNMPIDDYNNPMFTLLNGGKKLVALNLKTEAGKAVLFKLLADADVFISNVRLRSLEKLGLGYEQLKDRFPKLVYCHFTGYGHRGPDQNRPGYDNTAYWCRTGARVDWVLEGEHPLRQTGAYGDMVTSFLSYSGIVTALLARAKNGQGCFVSNSLYGAAVWVNSSTILGTQPPYNHQFPEPAYMPPNPFIGDYLCKDNEWISLVGIGFPVNFPKFATLLGLEKYIDDPRCQNEKTIKESGFLPEMREMVAEIIKTKTSDEWCKLIDEAGLVCSKLYHFKDVHKDEQAWANDYLEEVEFAGGQKSALAKSPVHLSGYEMRKNLPSGGVGADTAEVLSALGYTEAEIQQLQKDQAIK